MLSNTAINTHKLIEYHLGEINYQPAGFKVTFVQSGLMFCALVGLLYAVPASEYRSRNDVEHALNIAGSCYMSVLICYVAADMFFKMHLEKQWPHKELNGIVSPPLTSADFWMQNLVIGVFAFISGVPFASTAYTYPPAGLHSGLLYSYLAYVFVAEALLHFLPVKLTLEHPFYGALPRKAGQLWNYVRQHQKNPAELQQIQQAENLRSRRERLERRIKDASDVLLASFIPKLGQLDAEQLTQFLEKSSKEQFESLMRSNQPVAQLFPVWIENTARFLGAVIVLGSCLGYAANPFLLFMDWTGSWWGALLSLAVPLYFFGLLMTYFGDEYGKRILTDLATLVENMGHLRHGRALKLPLICRLYPVLMTALIMINIPLLVYSPAAAEQMMELAFNEVASSGVMTMLTVLAKVGTFILAWYAPLDFQQLMLKYVAQYIKTGDEHNLLLLSARVQTLAEDMLQLNAANVTDIEGYIEKQPDPKIEDSLQHGKQDWSWDHFKPWKGGADASYYDEQKVSLLEKGVVATGSF
jgi:hypothetical protein